MKDVDVRGIPYAMTERDLLKYTGLDLVLRDRSESLAGRVDLQEPAAGCACTSGRGSPSSLVWCSSAMVPHWALQPWFPSCRWASREPKQQNACIAHRRRHLLSIVEESGEGIAFDMLINIEVDLNGGELGRLRMLPRSWRL